MSEEKKGSYQKVIVCLTGFSKAEIDVLSQMIGSLGCVYESSLTTRTTHLVCATTNSVKYASAQRAGILCVTREWLDVSFAERHPVPELCPFIVPPLFGCVFCTTGFPKAEREVIKHDCISLGGTFSLDLTSAVTHLIAKNSSGQKYLFAKQRRIAIVSLEWLQNAVQTHSHPDEASFVFGSKGPEEGSHHRLDSSQLSSLDLVHSEAQACTAGAEDEGKKRDDGIRCGGEFGDEDSDSPKPLKGCQVAFYGFTTEQRVPLKRLLKELGAEGSVPLDCPTVTHVVVSSNPDIPKLDLNNLPFAKNAAVVEPRWLISCFQVRLRLDEKLFRPPQSLPSAPPSFMEQSVPPFSTTRRLASSVEKSLFSGFIFAIIGFDSDKTMQYQNQICSHNGVLYDPQEGNPEMEAKVNFILMPHGFSVDERARLKKERFPCAQFVSADWLELCGKTNVVLDLARSPVLTPLKFRPPFDTMMDVVISFSGFAGQDRLIHMALAHRLGASVTTTFSRRSNTHLIAANDSGDKFRAACRWGIPVVSINWLRQCAQIGDCAPLLISSCSRAPGAPVHLVLVCPAASQTSCWPTLCPSIGCRTLEAAAVHQHLHSLSNRNHRSLGSTGNLSRPRRMHR